MDTGQVRVQPRPGDLGQVGSSVMRTSTRKGIFRWRQQNDEKEENYKKDIKRENGRIRPYCHYFNYTDYDNSKINGQYMQLVEFVLSLETMKQTKKVCVLLEHSNHTAHSAWKQMRGQKITLAFAVATNFIYNLQVSCEKTGSMWTQVV